MSSGNANVTAVFSSDGEEQKIQLAAGGNLTSVIEALAEAKQKTNELITARMEAGTVRLAIKRLFQTCPFCSDALRVKPTLCSKFPVPCCAACAVPFLPRSRCQSLSHSRNKITAGKEGQSVVGRQSPSFFSCQERPPCDHGHVLPPCGGCNSRLLEGTCGKGRYRHAHMCFIRS